MRASLVGSKSSDRSRNGETLLRLLTALLLVIAVCPFSANAETIHGRVVSLSDGDTITILDKANVQYKIRLSGIDAPERKQAFGTKSRQHLAQVVFGKEVAVEWHKVDRYKRLLGKVIVNGVDANLEQVRAGLAWHYKYYQREQSPHDRDAYAKAEVEARIARRGLWQDAEPLPPWDYRQIRKGKGRLFPKRAQPP